MICAPSRGSQKYIVILFDRPVKDEGIARRGTRTLRRFAVVDARLDKLEARVTRLEDRLA